MNLRGIAFLAIRLFAIYVFLLGIRQVVNLVTVSLPVYMSTMDLDLMQVLYVIAIPTLLLWAFGILLWMMADRWSKRMIPPSDGQTETAIRSSHIESFVLSVVGVVIVVLAVSDLIQSVLAFLSIANQDVYFDRQNYYYRIAGQAVEIALGLVLVLKARGIAALLRKIRQA